MSWNVLLALLVGSWIGSAVTIFVIALAFAARDHKENKNQIVQEESDQHE